MQNHGFVDGNKRIGVAVMLLLLKLNDIKIKYSQKDLIKLGFGIADGSMKEKDITNWLKQHEIRQI